MISSKLLIIKNTNQEEEQQSRHYSDILRKYFSKNLQTLKLKIKANLIFYKVKKLKLSFPRMLSIFVKD